MVKTEGVLTRLIAFPPHSDSNNCTLPIVSCTCWATLTRDSLAIAIEALSWMAYAGLGERPALFRAAEQFDIDDPNELRQAHRLIMETTRYQNRLEFILTQILPKDRHRRTAHGIASFLKILTYLSYVTRARPRALVTTAEEGRQILGWKELQPYEKAIASIVSATISADTSSLSEYERTSLKTCHPRWFVERLTLEFGRDTALRMLYRNLQLLPTYARINPLKSHEDGSGELIRELGGSPIGGIRGVAKLNGASQSEVRHRHLVSGQIVIQDLASIIAGFVATPAPGSRVLDVCAAPGNKTSHLAALMGNVGEIWSIELSNRRLSHWAKEMGRTGTTIAEPVRADARRIPIKVEVDIALVDPPCSNSGVFARNPVVKWKITENGVREFSISQLSILQAASKHVRPGGSLVYCTCSVLAEENESVIQEFLGINPEFRLVPQTPFLGSFGLRGYDLCQRFYPHIHSCNGSFIAKLQKTG
jgi:16S rRNA (cytosine967-C5)-methyltransferase